MKKTIYSLLSLLVPFSLLFSFSPSTQEKVEIFEKTYFIDSTQPVFLEFHDVDGDLVFSSSKESQVKVKVKKEIRIPYSKRAERLLRETKVEVSQKGNHLTIWIKYPRLRGIFFWFSDNQRIRVSSEIVLPESSRLDCRMVDGSIRGQGVYEEMDLRTVDGSIRLNQVQGLIKAETVDGRINLNSIDGDVEAETVDGKISISGRLKGLRLDTVDGDVWVAVSSPSFMEKDWEIVTTDGNVDISLPSDFSANLFLQTRDGRIDSEFSLTLFGRLSQRKIEGKLNKGGPLIFIKTGEGHIALRKSTANETDWNPML